MRTLIMTVGTGRDRFDISEALVFSIDRNRPDRVVFLCSGKTAEQTLPILKSFIEPKKIAFEHFVVANEDDVQYLYGQYLEILRKFDPPQEIIVDFTSGTKAMSAAIFAAGIALQVGQVSYITGPRDETGRVIKSTHVEVIRPIQVYAEQEMMRAMNLFNHYEFAAARQLANAYRNRAEITPKQQQFAKEFYDLADAFDKWERFCWQQAASGLGKAARAKSELRRFLDVDALKDASRFCESVQNEPWSSQRLYDLAANAKRRYEQGRYDDALSRLYRAYEYLVQVRLKNQFNIETAKVSREQLTELKAPEGYLNSLRFEPRKKGEKPVAKLGLRNAIELLCHLGDQWADALKSLYFGEDEYERAVGRLAKLLDTRNQSWLAHGTTPADGGNVKSLLDELFKLLERFLTNDQINDYFKATQFPKLGQNQPLSKKLEL